MRPGDVVATVRLRYKNNGVVEPREPVAITAISCAKFPFPLRRLFNQGNFHRSRLKSRGEAARTRTLVTVTHNRDIHSPWNRKRHVKSESDTNRSFPRPYTRVFRELRGKREFIGVGNARAFFHKGAIQWPLTRHRGYSSPAVIEGYFSYACERTFLCIRGTFYAVEARRLQNVQRSGTNYGTFKA